MRADQDRVGLLLKNELQALHRGHTFDIAYGQSVTVPLRQIVLLLVGQKFFPVEYPLQTTAFEGPKPRAAPQCTGFLCRFHIGENHAVRTAVKCHRCLVRIRTGYTDNRRQPDSSVALTHPRKFLSITRNMLSIQKHKIKTDLREDTGQISAIAHY